MPEGQRPETGRQRTVSVIIPVCDNAALLPVLLRQVAEQCPAVLETIVLDSCQKDDLRQIVAAHHRVRRIIVQPGAFDHGATRALGVREALGETAVLLTQDVSLCGAHAIAELVRPLATGGKVAAAFGRQLPAPDAHFFARRLREHNYPARARVFFFEDRKEHGIKTAFCSNSFAAFQRNMLLQQGNFQSGLIFGEDMHMAARLLLSGFGVAYAAGACAVHSHNYSMGEDFRRYFDMGVFHRRESRLLEQFGTAEKEGMRYLAEELWTIISGRSVVYLPQWCGRTLMKFLGYFLGKRYVHLPCAVAVWCSLNRRWWRRQCLES